MCCVIVENEIDIGEIVLDVIQQYTPPVLPNPAQPDDVFAGKDYIDGTGMRQTGTALLEEQEVSPTREEITVIAHEGFRGLSSVTVNKIPDNYYEASVENQSLLLLSGGAYVSDDTLNL